MTILSGFLRRYPDLSAALASVARDRLVETLITLCSRHESFYDAVAGELLVSESSDGDVYRTENGVKKEQDGHEGDIVKKEEGDHEDHGEEDGKGDVKEEQEEEEEEEEDEEEYTDEEADEEEAKERIMRSPVNAPGVFDIASQMRPLSSKRALSNDEPLREGSNKRKRSRYEMCDHCDTEFDVTHNSDKDCNWHEEEVTPILDHEALADHDEDCHGPYDQDWIIVEWPQAFKYECCGGHGLSKGCQVGPHEGRTTKALKYLAK
ncbi:MAG: hypothetical protein Q9160_007652 [Pyrenula sp. 1 TL-2023]